MSKKAKATAKPSTKGKAKPEARTLAGRGIATGAFEVSLDNADTVIEGAPSEALRGTFLGANKKPSPHI